MNVINPDSMADIETAEALPVTIEPKYFEFQKEGETLRGYFVGFYYLEGKKLNSVAIQNRQGIWCNSGVALLGQFRNVPPGVAVEIKYTGRDGKVKTFEVRPLNVAPIPMAAPAPQISASTPAESPAPQIVTPAQKPAPAGSPQVAKPAKPDRPVAAETLRGYMARKIRLHEDKRTLASQFDRGVVAAKLEAILGSKEDRQNVTKWLIGVESIANMSQADIKALQDWLECKNHDQYPPQYVQDEARAVLAATILESGKV